MAPPMTSAAAIPLAAALLALALAACSEAEDPMATERPGENEAIGILSECIHGPEAAAAAAEVGLNVAEAPETMRVAAAGAGSNLRCGPEDLPDRRRAEERPPRASRPSLKPPALGPVLGRIPRRIPR
jgi:hypothetical protein